MGACSSTSTGQACPPVARVSRSKLLAWGKVGHWLYSFMPLRSPLFSKMLMPSKGTFRERRIWQTLLL